MTIKLTAPQLKHIIAEEAKKLTEGRRTQPTEDQLIDKLSEVKAAELKVRAIYERAQRDLKKLSETKSVITKKLLKTI